MPLNRSQHDHRDRYSTMLPTRPQLTAYGLRRAYVFDQVRGARPLSQFFFWPFLAVLLFCNSLRLSLAPHHSRAQSALTGLLDHRVYPKGFLPPNPALSTEPLFSSFSFLPMLYYESPVSVSLRLVRLPGSF